MIDPRELEYMMSLVSENKRALFKKNVAKRTAKIAMVLEDIYQSHNAAAVLRTCDCFGIQNVYIIENRNEWNPHPDIEQGSTKWLTLQRFNESEENTSPCLRHLREEGYAIVGTTPYTDMSIDELPTDRPVALVMGTEKDGISDTVKKESDYLVKIPMYGFTESFNISVAAAISLHSVRQNFEKSGVDMAFPRREKEAILLEWCKKTVKRSEEILLEFRRRLRQD